MRTETAARLMIVLAALSACKKDPPQAEAANRIATTGQPAQPAHPDEVERVAPPPAPTPVPPANTTTNAISRADLERAYLADCRYVNIIEFEDMEGEKKGDECSAREFDQNCAPDTFGCWDKGETCKNACSKPCSSCQGDCASTCDGCKSACAAKPNAAACKTACASARADCRDKCVTRLTACREKDCAKVEDECEKAGEAQRTKDCGKDCLDYMACMEKALGTDGDDACNKKFPSMTPKCREWCTPAG